MSATGVPSALKCRTKPARLLQGLNNVSPRWSWTTAALQKWTVPCSQRLQPMVPATTRRGLRAGSLAGRCNRTHHAPVMSRNHLWNGNKKRDGLRIRNPSRFDPNRAEPGFGLASPARRRLQPAFRHPGKHRCRRSPRRPESCHPRTRTRSGTPCSPGRRCRARCRVRRRRA